MICIMKWMISMPDHSIHVLYKQMINSFWKLIHLFSILILFPNYNEDPYWFETYMYIYDDQSKSCPLFI